MLWLRFAVASCSLLIVVVVLLMFGGDAAVVCCRGCVWLFVVRCWSLLLLVVAS